MLIVAFERSKKGSFMMYIHYFILKKDAAPLLRNLLLEMMDSFVRVFAQFSEFSKYDYKFLVKTESVRNRLVGISCMQLYPCLCTV